MTSAIGVPAEIKDGERRVVLDPAAVAMLTGAGLRLRIETGAGLGAGFADAEYKDAGAEIVSDAAEAWSCDIVCKVKEPQPSEWEYFRDDLSLFAYLHLAAEPALARVLAERHVTAHAFETITDGKRLPLLAPMSEVAGRAAAIHGGAQLATGCGVLPGGAAGVPPAHVVVIGLGVAGTMAARGLRGLDATVTGVDIDLNRLYAAVTEGTVHATLISSPSYIADAVAEADLVVGAALVPGARAPSLVSRSMVAAMRPGSVIVDIAIDQGGCVETSRPTTHSQPTFTDEGVVHYAVTNVPGQYPRTASRALSAVVAPRLLQLMRDPDHHSLEGSLNVAGGRIEHPVVAAALAA